MTETRLRPTVGVTIGDPAGIGPEIVVRALAEGAARQTVDGVVIGDRWLLQRAMGATGVGVEFVAEGSPRLIDLANVDHRLQWGKVQATAGAAAGQLMPRGGADCPDGRVARRRVAAIRPRIDEALRSIGVVRPRVAVAALNPHAGEGGALGLEDQEQIAPAVEEAGALA